MENTEAVERDDLAMVSMGVILHAGNAREAIFKAVDQAAQGKFEEADKLMNEANFVLIEAHKAQTSTLQRKQKELKFLIHHCLDMLKTM
ncbi:PTS lactose/cellobiose transporter subunit IIA [Lactococcus garvieae]